MREKTDLEMLWAHYRKALVARIRLKHSIKADAEINSELAKASLAFEKQIQKGIRPRAEDLMKAIDA